MCEFGHRLACEKLNIRILLINFAISESGFDSNEEL